MRFTAVCSSRADSIYLRSAGVATDFFVIIQRSSCTKHQVPTQCSTRSRGYTLLAVTTKRARNGWGGWMTRRITPPVVQREAYGARVSAVIFRVRATDNYGVVLTNTSYTCSMVQQALAVDDSTLVVLLHRLLPHIDGLPVTVEGSLCSRIFKGFGVPDSCSSGHDALDWVCARTCQGET